MEGHRRKQGTTMRRRALIGGLLAAPMIAACDADEEPSAGGTDDSGSSDGGGSDGGGSDGGGSDAGGGDSTGASVKTSVPVIYGPVEMEVEVASVVRSGERLVVTLDVTADDPDGALESGPVFALRMLVTHGYGGSRRFDGIRLLDLDGDLAAPTAMDADGLTVHTEPAQRWSERSGTSGTESVQLVYGDLGTDEVAVLIPKGGLLAGLPVLDEDVPEVDAQQPLDLSVVSSAPVNPLISYSEDLSTTTHTETTQESTTVSLGSDVLFDSSSAELAGDAQAVIEEAARSLAAHEPGPVRVVGHTDSVDDDDVNQTLSEQRAQAVADVLATLIDGAEYPLEVSGRGESEPIADNDTDEGRALNRRVELSIDTPVVTEQFTTRELPEIDGSVATGEEGLTFEADGAVPRHLRAPQARIVQDHLVVRLEHTRLDDKIDDVAGFQPLTGHTVAGLPLGYDTEMTEGGVAVMDGPVATLPAMHRMGGEGSVARPLTDFGTSSRIDGGVTRVSEIVYPAGIAVGETVTLQLFETSWRLTDIPVTR